MPKRVEDFTLYLDVGQEAYAALLETLKYPNASDPSIEMNRGGKDSLTMPAAPGNVEPAVRFAIERPGKQQAWRILACLCFRGRNLSVTARTIPAPLKDLPEWPAPVVTVPRFRRLRLNSWPRAFDAEPRTAQELSNWNGVRTQAKCIDNCLGAKSSRSDTGLIVVAGATGSGKSVLASALALEHLNRHAPRNIKDRQPHIVTFEDPIESWFAPDAATAQRRGFDYTPREKGVDATSLAQVVHGALRQTPTLLYIGETREKNDWSDVLHFAGTGHFAITTTHAASLRETMERILKALDAEVPTTRADVANRILGLVHMRVEYVDGFAFRVPSVWYRTPRTIAALTTEGLGAILPHDSRNEASDCFGRVYFAKLLYDPKVGLLRRYHASRTKKAFSYTTRAYWDLLEIAAVRDIRGE